MTELISKKEAVENVRLMAKRTALLYQHFAQTIIDELGEEKGKELITKAIWSYGKESGSKVKEGVLAMGLPPEPENYNQVPDLPVLGWEFELLDDPDCEEAVRITLCPLAEVWLENGFSTIGRIYCQVDQAKYLGYNPELECLHQKNVLDGDCCCEIVVKKKNKGS